MVTLKAEAIAARLSELGVATPVELERAKQELLKTKERFSSILVRQKLLRDADVPKRLAPQLGALPQRIDPSPERPAIKANIPAALWRAHRLVPVAEANGKLVVATDDPFSVFALELFGGQCGCRMEAVLVKEENMASLFAAIEGRSEIASPAQAKTAQIAAARKAQPLSPSSSPVKEDSQREGISASRPLSGVSVASKAAVSADDEPIIRLVDSILAEAARSRASDIHIEPAMDAVRLRYRIDGVLHDVNSPPKQLQGPMVSRLKIMSGLNIAEKRLPQDGRLQLNVEGRPMDVRVSLLPAMHGESIVMRLLDRAQPIRGLAEMGMLQDDHEKWRSLVQRPHGMILVTGPTGSGKTTTLYGALAMLNHSDRKLITVEDPVEYQLSGVNQVAVKSSIGLTFASALRAMLRQAPDVIMVGEIRDLETAQVAIQAALTGHLLLSTLHTNDAPSAIARLVDMGIPPFLVASTLQGVLAQRLIRRICPECRVTDNASEEERIFLGPPDIVQAIRSTGCEACHNSGFQGRIGLFEMLHVTDAIRRLIVAKSPVSAIRETARREGMRRLRQDGCVKIREGLSTMSEVLRVVSDMDE